ncbi:MAG: hypothetical protein ACOH2R_08550 [Pseudomonas sp.]
MMEEEIKGWAGGINNRANVHEVPQGYARDLVNLDPLVGGVLGLRSGFAQRAPATNARGALSVGEKVLFADGTSLICFDTRTNTTNTLAQIAGGGRFAGAVLNEELFFCTSTEQLRFDGSTLRPWGVPTLTVKPEPVVVGGGLAAGTYQFALTLINSQGEEGGCTNPMQITVPDASALVFLAPVLPVDQRFRLYVSSASGENLYLQYEGTDDYIVNLLSDDTARLDTLNLREPVGGDHIAALNAVLLIADGSTLWYTRPMSPHLLDASKSFFQFAAPISLVIEVDGGAFVCADKTYFLQSPEADQVSRRKVAEYGGVAGTASVLPDGRAAWMTPYGLAVGALDGSVNLLSQANFVPELASEGASGVFEHNGNQMVVTTMRGQQGPNPLAASDYYDLEILPT